jgi:stage II sporulation protein D
MTLFYKSIFCIFLLHAYLYAARWPLLIVSNAQKNVLEVSKKKYIIRSRISLKKLQEQENLDRIFSHVVLPTIEQQHDLDSIFAYAGKRRSIKIRVLLAKAEDKTTTEWIFKSVGGFLVQLEGKSCKTKKNTITIHIKRGCLFCNGKRVTNILRLQPLGNSGEFEGIAYDGDFILTSHKNNFLCINRVELEDYITAVLRTESWPGWPLEVNKSFAIACRSYVMFKMLEAKRSGRLYHVKNTNVHQTYRGKHQVTLLKDAVEQTRGVVMGFKGAPILAMFDCCCGGVIPAHIADFDFNKVPYLARNYACHYCEQSSLYSWQVSYEHSAFETLIKQYDQDIVRLQDISITRKDKAGLVSEVKLKGAKCTTVIPGKKLYSLLKEVKSFYFDVHKKSDKIIFTGRGFGHHIGLCQWGARQMVRDGWDYKSILRFYYPGAYFMHII